MTAAQELTHQLKWNLTRVFPWMLGSLALAIGGVMPLVQSQTLNPGLLEPQSWVLLPLFAVPYAAVVTAATIQADSPIDPSAFYQGRPRRWWILPVAKSLTLQLALGAPPFALVLLGHALWHSPLQVALSSAATVLLVQAGIVCAVWCAAACTRHVMSAFGTIILLYVWMTGAAAAMRSLHDLSLRPLGWAALVAAVVVTISLYRSQQSARRAQVSIVGLIALGLVFLSVPARQLQGTLISRHPTTTVLALDVDSIGRTPDGLLRVAYHVDAPEMFERVVVSDAAIAAGAIPVAVVASTLPNRSLSKRVVRVTDDRQRSGIRVLGSGSDVLGVEPNGMTMQVHDLDVSPLSYTALPNGKHRFDGVLVAAMTDLRVLDTTSMIVTIPVRAFQLRTLARTPLREATIWQGAGERVDLVAPNRQHGLDTWLLRVSSVVPMQAELIANVIGEYEVATLSGDGTTVWRFDTQRSSRSEAPFVALGARRYEVSVALRADSSAIPPGDSIVVRKRIGGVRQQFQIRIPPVRQ